MKPPRIIRNWNKQKCHFVTTFNDDDELYVYKYWSKRWQRYEYIVYDEFNIKSFIKEGMTK